MVVDRKKILAELKWIEDKRKLVRLKRIKDEKRLAELESVIEIEEEEFNRGKSFNLLKKVIKDKGRKGVNCTPRLRHSLTENLRSSGHKKKYGRVADLLEYRKGRLRLILPPDKIRII